MKYICMFLPALIASSQEIKKNDQAYKKIVCYAKYCLYINFIMLFILMILGKGREHFDNLLTVQYYLLYLMVGILLGNYLPKIIKFFNSNFSIKIRRIKK